jgi:putative addiction module component (TIGR02574 family)
MSDPSLSVDIKKLSVDERIVLIEEIWDSIVAENVVIPPTPAECAELDRRLEAMKEDPDAGNSWDTIKRRLRGNP